MPVDVDSAEAVALKAKVDDQGNKVRDLKTSGSDKADIDSAVQQLLQLKAEYKELTGVDLGGGGGKKAKKEKKAAAKGEPAPAAKPPAEKKAKANKQEKEVAKPVTPLSAQQTSVSVSSGEDRDMSMNAVLGRLAQRASKADTIIAQLKAQLTAVRQTAALSACKAEEERLKTENEALKHEVCQLRERLVQAEIRNAVPQVALPKKSITVSSAAAPKSTPAVVKQQAKPVDKDKQAASEAKPKKQEKKKESKPKAATPANSAEGESKVDVSRIDMRIGKIVNVKKHPEADTLYLEEVDVGEGKNRTILSGLVKHVPQDQMQDRLAIFMCNLKPAKMRGIFSEGMIMCGSTPEKVEIIEPPSGVSVGDKVYVEGYEGTPDTQLNPKKKIFEQVQPDLRISPEGVATYKGVAWKVKGTEGLCTVPTMRDTPIK